MYLKGKEYKQTIIRFSQESLSLVQSICVKRTPAYTAWKTGNSRYSVWVRPLATVGSNMHTYMWVIGCVLGIMYYG